MDNFLSIKEAVQRYSASCDGKIKTPFVYQGHAGRYDDRHGCGRQ